MEATNDESIKDIAWPVNIGSMAPPTSNSPILDDKGRKKRRRKCCGLWWWIPCLLCCLLATLLALAAILIPLLFLGKSTTTTETTTLSTVTTTATTTITSAPTTITTTTTTTTSTTTTTTTTRPPCNQSCLNQSWIDSTGVLAFWPFDGSFIDTTGAHNGVVSRNSPTFATGYVREAALFNASAQQGLYTSFTPMNNRSFTIEAWIQPTGFPNPSDHSIVGLCPTQITSQCLHANIRSAKLYFGFYNNDVRGETNVVVNQWIHGAFVYDAVARTQTIYLNGFRNAQNIGSNALGVTSGNITIGYNQNVDPSRNYFQGYIDQLSIYGRVQSPCEVLERATLAAYFKFDTLSPYMDSGPNAVSATSPTNSIISGYRNQAISLSGTSSSYFQASGLTSLGTSNQPFSITMWIQPQTLSGTLVHLSSSAAGTGSTCFPLLGFAANGAIIAQVLTSGGTVMTATGPVLPISSSWIPVVQTWSAANGLKLYVNNTLVNSIAASTFLGSGTTPNYVTLGGCLSGCGTCSSGLVGAAGPFSGAVDDWRIYSRELSSDDVCALYYGV